MKLKRLCPAALCLVVVLMALTSTAYACVVFRGKLVVTGTNGSTSDSDGDIAGGNHEQRCGSPAAGALVSANGTPGTITVEVHPTDKCVAAGAASENTTLAGLYSIHYAQNNILECIHTAPLVIGQIAVDPFGDSVPTPAVVPPSSLGDAVVCIGPSGASTLGLYLYSMGNQVTVTIV